MMRSFNIKLIFVGRLVALKWVPDLISGYIASWLNNELLIIWDGDESDALKKQAKWHNITFLWFQNADVVINLLAKNNCIFVNPSYQEGLPTTVIEWLATGNVVVATDVWGTTEISDKKDLIIISSGDINTLKEKLIYAVQNYTTLKWLSLKHIHTKFNWENNIQKLYTLIQ